MSEIQESNQTFHELWAMYARGLDGEVVEQTGILATWAGVQWPVPCLPLLRPIEASAEATGVNQHRSKSTWNGLTGLAHQVGAVVTNAIFPFSQ